MENINTTNTLSNNLKEFYEKTLIDNAEPSLVFDSFADKYPIPKHEGTSIVFRRYTSLKNADKSLEEGKTPNGSMVDVTRVEAQIKQYGDYIRVSDILQTSSIDNTILSLSKLLGAQAGRTLDAITRDELCKTSNVMYANSKDKQVNSREELDINSRLDADIFMRAAAKLESLNAPTFEDGYVAIVHPYLAYDLMKSPDWIESHKYARPENMYNGEIGKIGNIRFVKSSQAKIYRSKDLQEGQRSLKIQSQNGKNIVLAEDLVDADSMIGRRISINGELASVESVSNANTIVLDKTVQAKQNDRVYPAETGKDGIACFASIVLAAHAFASTYLENGGIKHIVKQNGYGEDPLNQRASVGWKANRAVLRLNDDFIIKIESASSYSHNVLEN